MSSKTKNLVGGKTLSLWIPDEDWVDDFNHLLAKRAKQDRSVTRNSLFLECVGKGLSHLDEQVDQTDSLRIYLDTFPPEQAELLRTPAGKQLVVNLLSAIISGNLGQIGQLGLGGNISQDSAAEQVEANRVPERPETLRPRPQPQPERRPSPPSPAYVAATREPVAEEPPKQERKVPDLFHTLMRNTKINN